MAATHMLKLEKIQYRCLRIALGLMQSTHAVPPLRLRFSMLNHKYLISGFSTGGHPLRRLLAMLSRLNVNDSVERELTSVGRNFHQMAVPRLVASETSEFDASSIFT
jgi:hypothetical protein